MDRRLFHIGAGDISGFVMDLIGMNINALVSGATRLGVVNGDQATNYSRSFGEDDRQFNFYPFLIHISVDDASGIVQVPILSIGTNSPNFDNVLSATTLTGLSALRVQSVYLPNIGGAVVNYGGSVFANVTGVAIGTTLLLTVSVIGALSA